MPFKKGQKPPPGAGRPKGSKNKKRVPLVSEFLGARGINPANEILKLLKELDPDQKLSAWKTLLSHTQPRVTEVSTVPQSPEVPEQSAPTAQLLSLVKGGTAAAAPKVEEQKTEQPTPETGKSGS